MTDLYKESKGCDGKKEALAKYSLSNKRVFELVEKYDLKYSQARRLAMSEDGMSILEIATIEGIIEGAVEGSICNAKDAIENPPDKYIDGVVLKHLPETEVRELVLEYILKLPAGRDINAHDIGEEYGVKFDCVDAVLEKMAVDGIIGPAKEQEIKITRGNV